MDTVQMNQWYPLFCNPSISRTFNKPPDCSCESCCIPKDTADKFALVDPIFETYWRTISWLNSTCLPLKYCIQAFIPNSLVPKTSPPWLLFAEF